VHVTARGASHGSRTLTSGLTGHLRENAAARQKPGRTRASGQCIPPGAGAAYREVRQAAQVTAA
jgi:hypothetical protein